jgi:tetratricopeptide (TPR) repeat protein
MTATLIDMLVPIPEIRVVDRQTSMEFKGSKQDLKTIAATLNSRYIVTGTVQRQDDKIMINAQMTDVESGTVLFSKSFPGKTLDLMGLQQQIGQTIVAELQLTFNADGLPSPEDAKTSSPQAHELCLKADFAEDHGHSDSSIAYYLQASRFDTMFAYPYLSLARIYCNEYLNDSSSLHDRARSPRELALADSFFAIGKRLDTAQEFSHFVGSWLANIHGDYDRAITEATSYIRKQPREATGYHVLGLSYFRMKQFNLAADNFAEYVKRCPISDYDRFLLLLSLWKAHDTVRLRQCASQAIPVYQASLARHPDDKDLRNNSIPLALVWAGRGDEACDQMEALLKTPNVDSEYVLNTAAINALSGKRDRAMQIMRAKIARSGVQSVDFERPFFDNLRQLPEFQTWVKQKEAVTKTNV